MNAFPVKIVVDHVTPVEKKKLLTQYKVKTTIMGLLLLLDLYLSVTLYFPLSSYVYRWSAFLLIVFSIYGYVTLDDTEEEIRMRDKKLLVGYCYSESTNAHAQLRPCTHQNERTFAINLGATEYEVYLNDEDVVAGTWLSADPEKRIYYYEKYVFIVDLDKLEVIVLTS